MLFVNLVVFMSPWGLGPAACVSEHHDFHPDATARLGRVRGLRDVSVKEPGDVGLMEDSWRTKRVL